MRIVTIALVSAMIATFCLGQADAGNAGSPNSKRADHASAGPDSLTFVAAYPAPWLTSGGAMTVGPDGDIWVAGNSTIARVTQAGGMTTYSAPDSGTSLSRGPDDSIWFSPSTAGIARISMQGRVYAYALPSGNSAYWVTRGPDGNEWFSDPNANAIGKITAQGAVTEYPDPDQSSPMAITSSGGLLWFVDQGGVGSGSSTVGGIIVEHSWGQPCAATGFVIGNIVPISNGGAVTSGFCTVGITNYSAILGLPNAIFPVRDAPYTMSPRNSVELWGLAGNGIVHFYFATGNQYSIPLPNGYSGAVGILDAQNGYLWVGVTSPPTLLLFKEHKL